MNFFKLLIVLLSIAPFSFAVNLDCTGIHNSKTMFTQRITINARTEVALPKLSYIQSKVKSMGNNQFEIEVFNPANPSRSYSTAVLKSAGDFLKWANWDRDAIFEIACIQK